MSTLHAFRFEPDPEGIDAVLRSDGIADALTEAAVQLRQRIQQYAPNGFMDYAQSVRHIPASDGPNGMQAAAGVDSPLWHLPEYGTINYPARAPIRKAARDIFDQFTEGEQ